MRTSEDRNKPTSRRAGEDNFSASSPFKRAISGLGSSLLSFAKFSGLIITTSIKDMLEAYHSGGPVQVRKSTELTGEGSYIKEFRITNDHLSAFYLKSLHGKELRETINAIHWNLPGGAILNFTDGRLVNGITNAVPRAFFSPEETESAEQLLREIRSKIKD